MAANALAALGESRRARQFAERACAIRPDDPVLLYNIGCVFSLLGLPDEALNSLEAAARKGVRQKGWYEHDSNLHSLRNLPRFRELLRGME